MIEVYGCQTLDNYYSYISRPRKKCYAADFTFPSGKQFAILKESTGA